MQPIYIFLLVLAVFLISLVVVLLVRAVKFKPKNENIPLPKEIKFDKKRAVQSLSDMIKIKTISNADFIKIDNEKFIEFRQYLKDRYPVLVRNSTYNEVANTGLVFHIKGKSDKNPTVLMAHYDVVPVTDNWKHDPFCGEVIDNYLWGRGTLDTKVSLLGVVEAIEYHLKNGFVPKNDMYIAFSGDEEVMGDSAPSIVEYLKAKNIKPSMVLDEGGAIVNNIFPGVCKPCAVIGLGEKGMMNVEVTAKSTGGHASSPPTHSAVGKVCSAIVKIEKKLFKAKISLPVMQMFDTLGRESKSFGIKIIFANMWLFKPVVKLLFTLIGGELSALIRTTCAVTMASGSKQINVLPSSATVGLNLRLNSGDSSDYALEYLKKAVGKSDVEVKKVYSFEPSNCSDSSNNHFLTLSQTIKENWNGIAVSPYLMMACSDSRHYCDICDNVYRFSPMELTSDERKLIHNDNERISISNIEKCVEFYIRLIEKL